MSGQLKMLVLNGSTELYSKTTQFYRIAEVLSTPILCSTVKSVRTKVEVHGLMTTMGHHKRYVSITSYVTKAPMARTIDNFRAVYLYSTTGK